MTCVSNAELFRYAATALGCLIVSLVASHAGAAPTLPSDDQIKARMQALSSGVAEALDRAGREVSKPGEIHIDVPSVLSANRTVDLEALARQFNGGRPALQKTGSDLMVFVTLAMPEHVIKTLARQAKAAGAVMVLRGLKGGSWPETWTALAALNQGQTT